MSNSICLRSYRQLHSFSLCTMAIPSELSAHTSVEDDVEAVYRVITTSTSAENLRHSLRAGTIFLSNELIDKVLKRFRFGHGNPLQALEFYKYTDRRKGFYHSSFSLNTLVYILGRFRKYELIWEVLRDAKEKDRSILSPTTVQVVLARIAKVCSLQMTVQSFWKFKNLLSNFDVECFNALLRAVSQEKSMRDARNVYHRLKNTFTPNLHTFNILLSGWRSSEEAEMFFCEMGEMGIQPDVVSYNSLLDAYCKGRQIDKASKLIEKMREEEISPDVITYTIMIGGLGLVGKPDKAKGMLKEMREYGCYPDTAAYNAAIRNFCIAKRMGDAFGLMDEMVGNKMAPNATTYNLFFRVFYWGNDLESAWVLYEKMMGVGCMPNAQTCMFLVRLCRRQEKAEMGLRLWGDMVERGFGSFEIVSDVILDMLCDMGMVDEAVKCFVEMVDKGHRPSHVSFKRIKVLLQLLKREDTIAKLSEHMGVLESSKFR